MSAVDTTTLILKAAPNPWACSAGHLLYNGNDGYLYDQSDVPWLTMRFGEPQRRETKYGTSFYFPGARNWRREKAEAQGGILKHTAFRFVSGEYEEATRTSPPCFCNDLVRVEGYDGVGMVDTVDVDGNPDYCRVQFVGDEQLPTIVPVIRVRLAERRS